MERLSQLTWVMFRLSYQLSHANPVDEMLTIVTTALVLDKLSQW